MNSTNAPPSAIATHCTFFSMKSVNLSITHLGRSWLWLMALIARRRRGRRGRRGRLSAGRLGRDSQRRLDRLRDVRRVPLTQVQHLARDRQVDLGLFDVG